MKIDKLEFDRRRPHALERQSYLENLDFKVRLLRDDQKLKSAMQLRKAVFTRHHSSAIGEHLASLDSHDKKDTQSGSTLFIAEAKADGAIVGSVRIQTNAHRPLSVEHEVPLPKIMRGRHLAMLSRMSIASGNAGKDVFLGLGKAIYLYCVAKQIHTVFLSTPVNSLNRMYPRFAWKNISDVHEKYSFQNDPGLEFSVFYWDIATLKVCMKTGAANRVYDFIFEKYHPDVEVFTSVASWYDVRRSDDRSENIGNFPT
jgi:hypothetical protein